MREGPEVHCRKRQGGRSDLLYVSWDDGVVPGFGAGSVAGLTLWGGSIAGFHRRIRSSSALLDFDPRSLIRQQSREIYLALYVMFGLRLAVGMATSLATHQAFDASDSMTQMQPLLAYGLLALLTLRSMRLSIWR